MQTNIFLLVAVVMQFCASVDFSTLDNKVLFGYQGWFSHPKDGSAAGWRHWAPGVVPNGKTVSFDLWPDVSEYNSQDLCATDLHFANGETAYLFSSYRAGVVNKHFEWMQQYQLDGVMLQRFVSELSDPTMFQFRNNVTLLVKYAAEQYGRVWSIMYDITGANADTFVQQIKQDWQYLVNELQITASPNYQHHQGKIVISIWGLGFTDRVGTYEQAMDLIQYFKQDQRAYLIGGVPYYWRTGTEDSKPNFLYVYQGFDMVSPWAVGRWRTSEQFEKIFYPKFVVPDKALTDRINIGYMPVLWPGFSWANLQKDNATYNLIPRYNGQFLQTQSDRVVPLRPKTIFLAMFDEVDEGTAMFKAATTKQQTPMDGKFLYLDVDGIATTSDRYLRIAQQITANMKKEF